MPLSITQIDDTAIPTSLNGTGAIGELDIFSMVNLPSPSWEFVFWIFFFIIVLVLGLLFRKNQIVLLIFSTYITLLLFYSFPGIGELQFAQEWSGRIAVLHPFAQAGVFSLLSFLFFFLFSRSIVSSIAFLSQSIISNLLLGMLWFGFFLSVVFTFIITPESNIFLGTIAESIFLGPFAQFSWMLLSLLGIALIKNPKKKQKIFPKRIKENEEDNEEEE
ncbi:hypothetical protein IIA94_01950 [Patescibacteria group bacterium]|nr:hypothetical protein [Patescibacteria group bacterium]